MLLWLGFMPQQLTAAMEKADSINEPKIITANLLITSDDGVDSTVPAKFFAPRPRPRIRPKRPELLQRFPATATRQLRILLSSLKMRIRCGTR